MNNVCTQNMPGSFPQTKTWDYCHILSSTLSWRGGKCWSSHEILSCEVCSFPLPFSKHQTAEGKKGDGKGRGNKASLMFSGSKATGQSRTDALGWQPGHSRCCSGPWLTSRVWDVIWLFNSGLFSLPVFLRPGRARQPVSSCHADNCAVQQISKSDLQRKTQTQKRRKMNGKESVRKGTESAVPS